MQASSDSRSSQRHPHVIYERTLREDWEDGYSNERTAELQAQSWKTPKAKDERC